MKIAILLGLLAILHVHAEEQPSDKPQQLPSDVPVHYNLPGGYDATPEFGVRCFDAITGRLVPESSMGYCRRSPVHKRALIASRDCADATKAESCDGECVVVDDWCACAASKNDAALINRQNPLEPKGSETKRCHVLTHGEMVRYVNGASPSHITQHVCFDENRRVEPHLKTDGFCGTRHTDAGPVCVSHGCEDDGDSQCVTVGGVCSCMANSARDEKAREGYTCLHTTAAELSAIVRGWPVPHF